MLTLLGNPGSPYSRKMRSALRYRRIPHRFVLRNTAEDRGTPPIPVQLLPVLVFPATENMPAEAMVDSTFQIRRLEPMYDGRRIVPNEPALAFIDFLLEDFADEWLTKAMYHYRWSFPESVTNAHVILPYWYSPGASLEAVKPSADFFAKRQIERRRLVGINESTAPLIEASYKELLLALDARLTGRRFVFGDRPGLSDFGLFGQLSQLVLTDPSSMEVARTTAPRIAAWCEMVEDLSGIDAEEVGWEGLDASNETLRALLSVIGRYYPPFLIANAAAVESRADEVQWEVGGRPWHQQPFGYQAKCLHWLRDAYRALPRLSREQVDAVLAGTGCEALFA